MSISRLVVWGLALLPGVSGAQPAVSAAPVVVDRVFAPGEGRTTFATGTIFGRQTMQITAGVAGRLLWVAEPGENVDAGDEVARIDAQPLILQRDEQQAMIRRASAQLAYLERDLQRREKLGAGELASEWEQEQTRAQRDLARSDIEIARIRVRQLDDQIGRAVVRASFAGQLSNQQHFAAEDVNRGDVLAQLSDTRNIEVRVQLPLGYRQLLRRGELLRVQAGEQQYVGTVRSIIDTADRASQTFEVRAALPPNAVGNLAVGQIAEVELPLQTRQQGLLVPRDALIYRRDATYVYRVNADGAAEKLAVEVGTGQGRHILVRGPLREGDSVAVRGVERLQPGQAVEIIRDLSADSG